jgi:hypothetical protein
MLRLRLPLALGLTLILPACGSGTTHATWETCRPVTSQQCRLLQIQAAIDENPGAYMGAYDGCDSLDPLEVSQLALQAVANGFRENDEAKAAILSLQVGEMLPSGVRGDPPLLVLAMTIGCRDALHQVPPRGGDRGADDYSSHWHG